MRLTSICWFGMRPSRGETIINVHNPGPITFSHIISCPESQFPSPTWDGPPVSPGPGHSSIALSLGSGEEFLLGDLFEHFESVRDKDGGYPLSLPGDHWPWPGPGEGEEWHWTLDNTPLLSGFKKTKLKHGAVCLTSLVFRHLRLCQSLVCTRPPPSSPSECLTRLERNLCPVTICRGSLAATVIAW